MPYQNDEIIFQKHISNGINSLNEQYQTPLMWAVSDSKRITYVKKLINLGVDVNRLSLDKNALNIAVENGNIVAVRDLIEAKANLNHVGSSIWDESALNVAIKKNHTECAKLLIEKKANVNLQKFACKTALEQACDKKNTEIIHLLLKNKATVTDSVAIIHALSRSDFTLKDQIKLLKEAKALDLVNSSHETLLADFARKGDLSAVKLLVEEKADINKNLGTYIGQSNALAAAIQHDRTACAKFLIEKKANLELKSFREIPLDIAIARRNSEITQLLIESKSEITNPVDTLLLLANRKEKLQDFIALFKKRNVLNVENQSRKTLLSHFSENGDLSAIKLLVEANADVNKESGYSFYKRNALNVAISNGHTECAKYLIEKKANIELKSVGRQTALDYAMEKENKELIHILLNQGAVVTDAIALLKNLSPGEMNLEKNISLMKKSNAINVIHNNEGLLSYFLKKNDLKSIQLLIDSKADVNVLVCKPHSYQTETALSYIINSQDLALITLFIENGAKIEAEHLDSALQNKNYMMINLLLANNAYPNNPNDFAKSLMSETLYNVDIHVAIHHLLRQQKNLPWYKKLSSEVLADLTKFTDTSKKQCEMEIKKRTFEKIDQLHSYHHLPTVLTNLIIEYDEYEPRLFQPTPASALVKERLNAEQKKEEEQRKRGSGCLVM